MEIGAKNNCRMTYGRIEAKVRILDAPVQGWKPTWLWWNTRYDLPRTDSRRLAWPAGGETDYMEGPTTSTMDVFMHWYGAPTVPPYNKQDNFHSGTTYTASHTIAQEWTPNTWKFFMDGRLFGTSQGNGMPGIPKVPNEEMRFLLQTETVLSNNVRPIAGQQQTLGVDYIKVWKYTPGTP